MAAMATFQLNLTAAALRELQEHLPAHIYASLGAPAQPRVPAALANDDRQEPEPLRPYAYDQWLQRSTKQLRKSHGFNLPFHRDFRLGFGLDGSQERKDKMNKIIDGLRRFHDRCARHLVVDLQAPVPGRREVPPVCTQPFSIYGAEREGKTNAQFSAQRAALDMGFAAVVFVAPTKVAPVVDMHTKLFTAGFENIKSTVADGKLPYGITSDTNYPRILVCAATNPADITKAGDFIRSNLERGILTVSFVDECDELVMGKPSRNAQSVEYSEMSDGVEVQVTVTDLAMSEKRFREVVQPYSMLFLITATYSGIHLKDAKFYIDDEPAVFIRVRKSEQYAGVANIKCPPRWRLPENTNTSKEKIKDLFQRRQPFDRVLSCFARRKNPSDGATLSSWLRPDDDPDKLAPIGLRGTLFVSLSTLVNVEDGAHDWSKVICKRLMELLRNDDGQSLGRPLVICFVGKPRVYTCSNQGRAVGLDLQSGLTIGEMVIRAMQQWPDNSFSHTAIVGYNLTRRAMTATYHLDGRLHTPMYAMVCFPKTSKLDADSQRLLRVGHDFGAYSMPRHYRIYAACEESKLGALKSYRKLEEQAFLAQERNPKTMAEFRDNIRVREHGLDGHHLTKRKLPMRNLGQQEPRAKRQRNHDTVYPGFIRYLRDVLDLADGTVNNYAAGLKRVMQEHPINTILNTRDVGRLNLRTDDHRSEISAVGHFRVFCESQHMTQELRMQLDMDDA